MKKILVVVGMLVLLTGCDDIMVSWDSVDVIDNDRFIAYYTQCSEQEYFGSNATGQQFKNCLFESYNLSKLN